MGSFLCTQHECRRRGCREVVFGKKSSLLFLNFWCGRHTCRIIFCAEGVGEGAQDGFCDGHMGVGVKNEVGGARGVYAGVGEDGKSEDWAGSGGFYDTR